MKSRRRIMKSFVFVGLVLVFALSLVSYSEAQKDPKPIVLKGDYGIVGQDVCVGHWTQNPNGPNAYDSHWTVTSTIRGIATFNTNGTGTADVKKVTIVHPIYTPIPSASLWGLPIPPLPLDETSVSVSNVSSEFRYEIYSDRAIGRHITSSGQYISGGNAGKFIRMSDEFTLTGFISSDMQTIIETSAVNEPVGPMDYTSTVSICNNFNCEDVEGVVGVYGVQEQTCQRTRILTLISK